jgi:hypothetical protein
MKDEISGPGVENADEAQESAQALGIASQILEGGGGGVEEERVGELGMSLHPVPKLHGNCEGDHVVRDGKKESLTLLVQPMTRIGLTAEGTMTIVAGVSLEMFPLTLGTAEEFSPESRSSTAYDLEQDLLTTPGQRSAPTLEVGRGVTDQELVKRKCSRFGVRGVRAGHGKRG